MIKPDNHWRQSADCWDQACCSKYKLVSRYWCQCGLSEALTQQAMGMGKLDANPGDVRKWSVHIWGIIIGVGMPWSAGLGVTLFSHSIWSRD
jgi:hypothetical protein